MPKQQELKIPDHEIAILAGNSRVSLNESDGSVIVEPQIGAFRAALMRAVEIRKDNNTLPPISVAFDHKGIFRKQFLADNLTNSQKRTPRLSQLRGEIVAVFKSVADEIGVPLDAITAIHEDSARTHASHVIQNGELSGMLIKIMKIGPEGTDDADAGGNARVSCAAVTSEYYSRSLGKDSRVLEVFIEDDPWTQVNVYTRGASVMKALGSEARIRLHLVNKQGETLGGKPPTP